MDNFKSSNPFSFYNELPLKINKNWLLICAGKYENYNMMTASWATFGILWNKPIAQIFVRPSRYTHDFLIQNDYFSINFFDSKYHDLLSLLGSKSGRNFNKMNIEQLTPINYNDKTIFFDEANEVLILKKIYFAKMDEKVIDDSVIKVFYPEGDFHTLFIGEILDYLIKSK